MVKKIAIFNHKGGVSKTTSAYHIGWKLTDLGKKVLLVDADSQCNLTILALGEEEYESYYTQYPKKNLKEALKPAFNSDTSAIQPMDCINVKNNPNLFLLPGNIDLGEYEVELAFSFLNSFGVMKNLPGAFNYLLNKTAEKYNIDYILIDMNPSLSALNQDIILTSDFFMVPTSPDYFSSMAISSLSNILPKWETWAQRARANFADAVYPMPDVTAKFLGYTINDFSIRKGKPSAAFEGMIENIETAVLAKMIGKLDAVGMLLPSEKYSEGYCLGQIHDFGSLVAKSQEYGLPVFALDDIQIGYTGTVLDNAKKNIRIFDQSFLSIAQKIINRSI